MKKNSDEDDESWIPGFNSGNLVCVRHCCGFRSEKPDPIQMVQWIQFQQGRNGPPKFEKKSCLNPTRLEVNQRQLKFQKISLLKSD